MASSRPYSLTSLIGGVSEQAPQDRTPSAAEDQINCINFPLKGAVARPGAVVLGAAVASFVDPFVHYIQRSNSELYAVLVENGQMLIFNMVTGAVCTRTNPGVIDSYLTHTGPAREAFDAVTVEDTTFLVNRQRTTAMKTTKSPIRPNRALYYFKSASYSTTYRAHLVVGGVTYTASYVTPDNSAATNAQFIVTNNLAIALANALNTLKSVTPALAGFSFWVSGSMVVVDGGASSFEVDSDDGAGDSQLIAFKQWIKKFSDLPARCMDGYVVGIRGSAADQKSDYYLKYYGAATTGYWEEIVAPDTRTTIDETTMPHTLVNTGVNTFNCVRPAWGQRICGDGEKYAKDPTYIGKRITSVNFLSGRLCLTTTGSFMLSRSRNAYSFFPDTAQTRLATDPVGFDVANGSVTIIKQTVAVSERLFFWGDGAQIRHDSGDSAISEETSEALPSTNYEYDGRVKPQPIGVGSIIFGTQLGGSTAFTEVMYKSGTAIGEMPLTDHCPNYIKGSLKGLFLGGPYKLMGAITDVSGANLWIYQWLNQGDSRVQTAWNKWTFEAADRILGGSLRNGYVYLLVQMGTKVILERMAINPTDVAEKFIRLDHRVTEAGSTFDPDTKEATLTLPYSVPVGQRGTFMAIENEDDGASSLRGRQLPVEWLSDTSIKVRCELSNGKFWFGSVPTASRRYSRVYIQTKDGTVLPDECLISRIKVSHFESTSYKCFVRGLDGSIKYSHKFEGRTAISPDTPNSKLPLRTGEQDFEVDAKSSECWVDLVNDTPYPSCWVASDIIYSVTKR